MKTRQLGKSKTIVSEVGLGCWQFGGDFGSISTETSLGILQEAVDNNISFFDTADVYGDGISEEVIGKFLKTTSKKIFVATKFGRRSDVYPDNYTKEKLVSHVKDSINRLGVESLDLLQLHCIPFEVLKKGEIFTWLREIKEQGLIKEFGASVESVEEALFCAKQEGLLSLQVIFNIFRQKLIVELFALIKEKNIAVIVRLPLASGLLSGKFTKDTKFEESDHRNFNKDGEFFNVGETFAGLELEKGIELTKEIEEIKNISNNDIKMSQFALRWILDNEVVSVIIPGASSKKQVQANASSSDLEKLDIKTHERLSLLYKSKIHKNIRGVY